MPVAVAVFLTLFYAFASPLGIRIRAAEQRALVAVLPGVPSASAVTSARALLARGWPSLVASELWLLLLLASLIVLFQFFWLAVALPVVGVLLRFFLHALDPYPRRLDWYLARFRDQLEQTRARAHAQGDEDRERRAAALLSALGELAADEGDEPVLT
jgi:hypothetical protein